jgi:Capsular polysaccharide synthesis protein
MVKFYLRIFFILLLCIISLTIYIRSPNSSITTTNDQVYSGIELANSIISSQIKQKLEIPKVFYTFWHSQSLPKLLKNCIKSWKLQNPGYRVVVISRNSIERLTFLQLPPNFDLISHQYQADWVRLAILMKNGGIWVDASFIMTTSIQPLLDIRSREGTEGFQFFMDKFTSHVDRPYFENWFIAAVPASKYIAYWFIEFNKCFVEFGMTDVYLDHLKDTYGTRIYNSLVQASDSPSYLKQHLTLQKVLLVDKILAPSTLSALKPPYGPFYFQRMMGWDSFELVNQLVQEFNPWYAGNVPAFVKLTSYERDIMRMQTVQGMFVFLD